MLFYYDIKVYSKASAGTAGSWAAIPCDAWFRLHGDWLWFWRSPAIGRKRRRGIRTVSQGSSATYNAPAQERFGLVGIQCARLILTVDPRKPWKKSFTLFSPVFLFLFLSSCTCQAPSFLPVPWSELENHPKKCVTRSFLQETHARFSPRRYARTWA